MSRKHHRVSKSFEKKNTEVGANTNWTKECVYTSSPRLCNYTVLVQNNQ